MEVLERGDIQFWIRPTVQAAEADHYEVGVQALFAVLSPAGRGVHRRVRIGRKRLPRFAADRFWARVERVGSLQDVLGDKVDAERYTTRTRGERYQPGAVPIARGEYVLVRSDDHVRLSYTIDGQGSAPTASAAGWRCGSIDGELPADDHAELPHVEAASHLVLWKRRDDEDSRWSTAGGTAALDRVGTQLVLVGAKPPVDLAAA